MIDTHCHLTFPEFAGRTAEILAAAREVGVRGAITISTTAADALAARDLAQQHANLWHSAGVHPLHSDEACEWNDLRRAAESPKCVAWGELGLDNHYTQPPRDVQRRVLEDQLAFIAQARRPKAEVSDAASGDTPQARRLKPHASFERPLILHCREAFDDLIAILRASSLDPQRMVFHCFTGSVNDARKVLDFGAWISFTGVVTFHGAREVAEAARLVPADRMMVETDSPFLSPEPVRKVRPNEPKFVVHVARRLATLRGVRPEELERTLDANAERFFGIRLA